MNHSTEDDFKIDLMVSCIRARRDVADLLASNRKEYAVAFYAISVAYCVIADPEIKIDFFMSYLKRAIYKGTR